MYVNISCWRVRVSAYNDYPIHVYTASAHMHTSSICLWSSRSSQYEQHQIHNNHKMCIYYSTTHATTRFNVIMQTDVWRMYGDGRHSTRVRQLTISIIVPSRASSVRLSFSHVMQIEDCCTMASRRARWLIIYVNMPRLPSHTHRVSVRHIFTDVPVRD